MLEIETPPTDAFAVKAFTLSIASPLAHTLRALETLFENYLKNRFKDPEYYVMIRIRRSAADQIDETQFRPKSDISFNWCTPGKQKILKAEIVIRRDITLAEARFAISHELYHLLQYILYYLLYKNPSSNEKFVTDCFNHLVKKIKADDTTEREYEQYATDFADWLCHCHHVFLTDDSLRNHYKAVSELFLDIDSILEFDTDTLMDRLSQSIQQSSLGRHYAQESAKEIFDNSEAPEAERAILYDRLVLADVFDRYLKTLLNPPS
jgi:hypothetical protein